MPKCRVGWYGIAGATLTLIFTTALLQAQFGGDSGKSVRFEAASVRLDEGAYIPNVSGGPMRGGPGTGDPGRVSFKQVLVKTVISTAYNMPGEQIVGPAWLGDASGNKVTIEATLPRSATKDDVRLMLQNLLAERFHLKAHHETRDFPGYDLVAAPEGIKARPWTPDSADANAAEEAGEQDSDGFPRLAAHQTGFLMAVKRARVNGEPPTIFLSSRLTMAQFASRIGPLVNTSNGLGPASRQPRVVDRTESPGVFEIRLQFQRGLATDATSDSGVTLFGALEHQAGLKLIKVKGEPEDVLVVDQIDKIPTAN